ncbi:hypothetical protein ACWD4L_45580 [Streptomyces sp. NPDC002596]
MPKILRAELTSDQECEVRERLRARSAAPGPHRQNIVMAGGTDHRTSQSG